MKILFFSVKKFEKISIHHANKYGFQITMKKERLTIETAFHAKGFDAICIFTTDDCTKDVLKVLYSLGIRYITIRAAGYNNIDIDFAYKSGIKVANVPNYSPNTIAEHTIMMMMLNLVKKSKTTQHQLEKQNFTLDNLIGNNIQNKTIGIIGTGKIGSVVAKILSEFDAKLLGYDLVPNEEIKNKYGVNYVTLDTLCKKSDLITIHIPLNESTKYLLNNNLFKK